MTTSQIESLANRENVASADFDVGQTLRELVIPEFLADVDRRHGKVFWRRQRATISVIASTTDREYDLAKDFGWLEMARFYSTSCPNLPDLKYIGEDPEAVIASEMATIQARPTAYDIVTGDTNRWALKFNCFPDAAYTCHYVYYRGINFDDYTSSVNLNPLIPPEFHSALVHKLSAYIYENRYGIKDQRAAVEHAHYDKVLDSMRSRKEGASRNRAVFVR